jgi:hypothetical protein
MKNTNAGQQDKTREAGMKNINTTIDRIKKELHAETHKVQCNEPDADYGKIITLRAELNAATKQGRRNDKN